MRGTVRLVGATLIGDWSAAQHITIPAPTASGINNSLSLDPDTGGFALIPLDSPITMMDFTLEAWVKVANVRSGGCVYGGTFSFLVANDSLCLPLAMQSGSPGGKLGTENGITLQR